MATKKTASAKSKASKTPAAGADAPMLVGSRTELKKLKEVPFCKRVLVPLFEAMKYRDVRFTGGGPLEQGKDITMWEADALEQRANIAVVAKVGKITGSVASAGEVVTQIQQCFGSPFFDNASSAPQSVHRCFVVTNDEITKEGRAALISAMKGASIAENRVTLMDLGDIWTLLQKHRSHIALLGTMKEAYDALNASDPDYAIELAFTLEGVKQAIVAKRKDALPMTVSFAAKFSGDDAGQSKLAEFQTFMKSGGSFTLEAEFVEKLELPPIMQGLTPQNAGFELSFTPAEKKRLPMSITARPPDGDPITIPFVNFRTVIDDAGRIQMANDEQNVPYRFTITFDETKRASVDAVFEFARGTFATALRALRFIDAIARGGSMILRDLEDETEDISGIRKGIERPHPLLIELVQKVVEIEQVLGLRFTVPATLFAEKDPEQVVLIHRIVTTGRIVSPSTAAIELVVHDARKLLDAVKGDLPLVMKGPPVRMLGQLIDLGDARTTLFAAKVHPDDAKRIREMSEQALNQPTRLRLVSGSDQPIVTEYPKWTTA